MSGTVVDGAASLVVQHGAELAEICERVGEAVRRWIDCVSCTGKPCKDVEEGHNLVAAQNKCAGDSGGVAGSEEQLERRAEALRLRRISDDVGPTATRLQLAPQTALVARDAVHDERDVSKLLSDHLLHGGERGGGGCLHPP